MLYCQPTPLRHCWGVLNPNTNFVHPVSYICAMVGKQSLCLCQNCHGHIRTCQYLSVCNLWLSSPSALVTGACAACRMSTQPSECNAIKESGWVPGLPQGFLEKLKTPNPNGCELMPKSTYKVARVRRQKDMDPCLVHKFIYKSIQLRIYPYDNINIVTPIALCPFILLR